MVNLSEVANFEEELGEDGLRVCSSGASKSHTLNYIKVVLFFPSACLSCMCVFLSSPYHSSQGDVPGYDASKPIDRLRLIDISDQAAPNK